MVMARRSRDGGRVLCGRPDCGAAIAYLRDFRYGRWLYFPMGSAQGEDGVWRYSAHARDRLRRGKRPRTRRTPRVNQDRRDFAGDSSYRMHPVPHDLPVRVECPPVGGCGCVNVVGWDVLALSEDSCIALPLAGAPEAARPVPYDFSVLVAESWDFSPVLPRTRLRCPCCRDLIPPHSWEWLTSLENTPRS